MAEELETLLPDLATEFEAAPIPEIKLDLPIPEIKVPEIPSSVLPAPPSESDAITSLKSEGDFLAWAIDSSLAFLNLADLDRVKTVGELRGLKEAAIRDRIQMANSVLVLAANYGSEKDSKELVKACELYADKMKTIIKRLCL